MRKGQIKIIAILLVIIILVLILIAYILLSQPKTTGDVIKETTIIKDNEIVCNSPYIQLGKECCLDKNKNSICDNEEEINVFTDWEVQEIETTISNEIVLNS